jgi:hypothetical protein
MALGSTYDTCGVGALGERGRIGVVDCESFVRALSLSFGCSGGWRGL